MLVEATAVVWKQPIITMGWTWRAGGQTSTAMEDTREAAPAAVEEELTMEDTAAGESCIKREVSGERPVRTRVVSMTAGRQSGTQHTKIIKQIIILTPPHPT